MADKLKLTEAQAMALVALMQVFGPRAIDRRHAKRRGLLNEFNICRRAKLIQSAGYECSVAGDEWLESSAGRAHLASTSEPKPDNSLTDPSTMGFPK